MSFLVAACGGPEGPEGQIGPNGPIGPAGNPGLNGADGDGGTGADGEDGEDGENGADGEDAGAYDFRTDAPGDYARVDRAGMPAVATAVISDNDGYNAADPIDDVNGDFVADITAKVTTLHDALDDDLTGMGLTVCAPDDCVDQAAPLIVPDTLKINITNPAGFPNGRLLTDPVVDITLALVLLDVSVEPLTALLGTNPLANDVPFMGLFPYTAAPHQ